MGFETSEFLIDLEAAFGLTILDADACQLATPRHVINYIASRVPIGDSDYSLMDRAFQKLQGAITEEIGVSASAILPQSSLYQLFPESDRSSAWSIIGQRFRARRWPKIGEHAWFSNEGLSKLDNVEKMCAYLVAHSSLAIKAEGEGWTRSQIADVVHRLIVFTLTGNMRYTEDTRFGDELGIA